MKIRRIAVCSYMVSLPDLILPRIKHIGVSIERQSLHAVELDDKGKPVHMAEVQIPQDAFVDGILINTSTFIDAVKKMFSDGKFTTSYVAVCFPEVFAYTRGYTVPAIPDDEIQEAITWHVKDLFPFPKEDIYYDWKILDKTEKENHTTVVAIQKKVLDPLVDAIKSAGLNPLRFEPDASALARLIVLKPKQHALLVDVNPQGAYVTLAEGDKALFTTVVNYTQEDTPTSYVGNVDQTLVEIAAFYTNKGILQQNSTQIIVTGQMASAEWVTHINQLLNYQSTLLSTAMQNQSYNKAYAAALEKIAPPTDSQSINLLPQSVQTYFTEHRNSIFYKRLLSRSCIIAGFICSILLLLYFAISIERVKHDTQVKELRKLTQSQQPDTQSLLLLNAQAKNIASLSPLKKTPNRQLAELSKLVGEKIIITQWEFDDSKQQFKISGTAATREDLLRFKSDLDSSEYFAKVVLPLGTLETPVSVPFTMTFLLKQ